MSERSGSDRNEKSGRRFRAGGVDGAGSPRREPRSREQPREADRNDRGRPARNSHAGGESGRGGLRRRTDEGTKAPRPAIPDDVTPHDLDSEVRRDLRSLDKNTAERVARHLVMVSRLLTEDPETALEHARAARGSAPRVAVVREVAGVAAYNAQEWNEALTELRAARRMSGDSALLPLIADTERGLGRPDRAIDIARSEEGRALVGDEATEMKIVESGARLDLGEPDKAVVTLQGEDLDPGRSGTAAARLFYAYAAALQAAGRRSEAMTWFMNAASADVDDVTDAELRLDEMSHDEMSDDTGDPRDVVEVDLIDTPASELQDPPAEEPHAPPVIEQQLTLTEGYDALLLDLDGTLFTGHAAIPGARETLSAVVTPQYFVTNNASRRADEVAEHLQELGFSAEPEQVMTSAQSAAQLLAQQLEPGALTLVIGSDGLAAEVREVGLRVTRSAGDGPDAVVQGHSPDTGWVQLSEGALAIRAGAKWIATNTDLTLPSERGFMVGNGSMVAAVASATGATPEVAGKPHPPIMRDAIALASSTRPLVVGDRLDTDIEGANAVGADSLLVLSGVSTLADAAAAPPSQRPTHVATDISALQRDPTDSRIGEARGWVVTVVDSSVHVTAQADTCVSALPAAILAAVWSAGLEVFDECVPGDAVSAAALRELALIV